MGMKEKIAEIHAHFSDEMQSLDSTQSLESLRVKVLGKKGELTALLRGMGQLSPEERPQAGQMINEARESSPECWMKSCASSRPGSRKRR